MNLMHFLSKNTQVGDHSLLLSDPFPLDDESIAERAINAMLMIINNSTRTVQGAGEPTLEDYISIALGGISFPWKDRIAFGQEIDLVNDKLPEFAAVGLASNTKEVFGRATYATRLLRRKNIDFAALRGAAHLFRVGIIHGMSGFSRSLATAASRAERTNLENVVEPYFAGVMPDGYCVGCDVNGHPNFVAANLLAYTIGLDNDKRYFWCITAQEENMPSIPAKAHFSIDEEYVKSLFYARTIPITSTGRLRPILHWVSAHKRRLKEGIDVDVRKHLRGIEAFSMHGVNFKITQPVKATALTARKTA